MSVDDANNEQPTTSDRDPTTPSRPTTALRREALLPNERGRGLGTVAVVCTMAGVASGLALATTLMAMQVADSMSIRNCPYRVIETEIVEPVDHTGQGFLGILYSFKDDGFTDIEKVSPATPAALVGIRAGDHLLAIDGHRLHADGEAQEMLASMHPGSTPTLLLEHDGAQRTVTPTLVAWPVVAY